MKLNILCNKLRTCSSWRDASLPTFAANFDSKRTDFLNQQLSQSNTIVNFTYL